MLCFFRSKGMFWSNFEMSISSPIVFVHSSLTVPLKDHGFHLDKRSFWDAIYIRYNLPLEKLPSNCVCGLPFTLDHALTCKRGGYIAVRHNDMRDLAANLLSQVCHDVKVEPLSHWREF